MGLDQYLYGAFFGDKEAHYMLLGEWRKANQIHCHMENIFMGVNNCQFYELSVDEMKDLKKLCLIVLEHKELAPKILPTTEGFFFGTTDYDEWYFEQLKRTIDIINDALEQKFDNYYYYAWW